MKIALETESYVDQQIYLPENGNHIIAHHDEDSIIVYQAYRPAIGMFAAKNGFFGGPFSFDRMTWIKTNFLWMMYRSGWGTKKGQEVILAIRLKKCFFDKVLSQVVPAIFEESRYHNKAAWKNALISAPMRLQWDPDRDPRGNALSRRAIQLGLKGKIVQEYAQDAVLNIYDISEYVKFQRRRALSGEYHKLFTPKETVYLPPDNIIEKVNVSTI